MRGEAFTSFARCTKSATSSGTLPHTLSLARVGHATEAWGTEAWGVACAGWRCTSRKRWRGSCGHVSGRSQRSDAPARGPVCTFRAAAQAARIPPAPLAALR